MYPSLDIPGGIVRCYGAVAWRRERPEAGPIQRVPGRQLESPEPPPDSGAPPGTLQLSSSTCRRKVRALRVPRLRCLRREASLPPGYDFANRAERVKVRVLRDDDEPVLGGIGPDYVIVHRREAHISDMGGAGIEDDQALNQQRREILVEEPLHSRGDRRADLVFSESFQALTVATARGSSPFRSRASFRPRGGWTSHWP